MKPPHSLLDSFYLIFFFFSQPEYTMYLTKAVYKIFFFFFDETFPFARRRFRVVCSLSFGNAILTLLSNVCSTEADAVPRRTETQASEV